MWDFGVVEDRFPDYRECASRTTLRGAHSQMLSATPTGMDCWVFVIDGTPWRNGNVLCQTVEMLQFTAVGLSGP